MFRDADLETHVKGKDMPLQLLNGLIVKKNLTKLVQQTPNLDPPKTSFLYLWSRFCILWKPFLFHRL